MPNLTTTTDPLVLYGFDVSPHVRAARIAFAEKNVPVRFERIALDHVSTAAYVAINPFQKMPALRHGNLVLYETPSLMVYANGIGDGPSLEPDGVASRAIAWKFVGVAQNYLYPRGVMGLFFHRVLAPLFGLPVDDAVATAAVAATSGHLDVLDGALAADYLAGSELSFADLYCGVMADYVGMTGEGRELLAARPRLSAWLGRLRERTSFRATLAPILAGAVHT